MQDKINKISKDIDELKNLQTGWFDGEGQKFDPNVLDSIKDYLIQISIDNPVPYIYPYPQCNVSAEWDFNDYCVSVEFDTQDNCIDYSATNISNTKESYAEVFPMNENSINLIVNELKKFR